MATTNINTKDIVAHLAHKGETYFETNHHTVSIQYSDDGYDYSLYPLGSTLNEDSEEFDEDLLIDGGLLDSKNDEEAIKNVIIESDEFARIHSKKETFFDESKYTYDESIISFEFVEKSQLGMLETYGDDYAQVKSFAVLNHKRLWSVLDGEDDKIHVVTGLQNADAVYYIITNEEWNEFGETYLLGGE